MHTLGHDFIPAPIHAGGLRYHGVAPLISQLVRDGLIRAEAYLQNDVFDAAVRFARTEGIIPAPESAHAIYAADRIGAAGGRGRPGADDPLQSLRPRPLRHGRLRQLLRGEARGRRAGGRGDRACATRARGTADAGIGTGPFTARRAYLQDVPPLRSGAPRRAARHGLRVLELEDVPRRRRERALPLELARDPSGAHAGHFAGAGAGGRVVQAPARKHGRRRVLAQGSARPAAAERRLPLRLGVRPARAGRRPEKRLPAAAGPLRAEGANGFRVSRPEATWSRSARRAGCSRSTSSSARRPGRTSARRL